MYFQVYFDHYSSLKLGAFTYTDQEVQQHFTLRDVIPSCPGTLASITAAAGWSTQRCPWTLALIINIAAVS
ncbi:hypothetical protein ACOMHN_017668 [Nucella lapillus]